MTDRGKTTVIIFMGVLTLLVTIGLAGFGYATRASQYNAETFATKNELKLSVDVVKADVNGIKTDMGDIKTAQGVISQDIKDLIKLVK